MAEVVKRLEIIRARARASRPTRLRTRVSGRG